MTNRKLTDFFTFTPKNVVISKTTHKKPSTIDSRTKRKKLPKNFYNDKCIADRKLGDENETIITAFLKKWFKNSCFQDDKSGWRVLDYVDKKNKIVVELKSRRIHKYQYETIMIGKNKYIKSRKMMMKGYKAFFLFKFTDRICIYPVPMILPPSIETRRGGTNKRGRDEYSDCLYIPNQLLYDVRDYKDYDDFKNKIQMK